MERQNKFTIGVLVFAILVLGVIGFTFRKPIVNVVTEGLGAFPGPDITSEYLSINGVSSYYKTGTCANATTSVFIVANPFNATSTVDFAVVKGTNGTSTIDFLVGTTTDTVSVTTGDVSASLLNASAIATSTEMYLVSGQLGSGGESQSGGTGSLSRIVVKPAERIAGFATSTATSNSTTYNTGVTGGNNTFSCTYIIRFVR